MEKKKKELIIIMTGFITCLGILTIDSFYKSGWFLILIIVFVLANMIKVDIKKLITKETIITMNETTIVKRICVLENKMNIKYDDMQQVLFITPKRIHLGCLIEQTFYCYIVQKEGRAPRLRINTELKTQGWIFFNEIIIKTDNENFTLDFDYLDKYKKHVGGGMIIESIDILVQMNHLPLLEAIVASKNEVKMRYSGDDYYKDYILSKSEINKLKEIYELYLLKGQLFVLTD